MKSAAVVIKLDKNDPALVELRKTVHAAKKLSATGKRRHAFLAGWRLANALNHYAWSITQAKKRART